ncbi:hypothetical protein [Hoyosella altamirensis]|uniref:Uncharacterized protein n=1 Tax=Hoyosella altamirensis TaxID=616997 RepID=A0A839RVA9_9ACTN|nr:hypothetical protein [Hoyosella altamirensis]MBB3040178.1 hypothetical protein [Hoyosella altamirensis]
MNPQEHVVEVITTRRRIRFEPGPKLTAIRDHENQLKQAGTPYKRDGNTLSYPIRDGQTTVVYRDITDIHLPEDKDTA